MLELCDIQQFQFVYAEQCNLIKKNYDILLLKNIAPLFMALEFRQILNDIIYNKIIF